MSFKEKVHKGRQQTVQDFAHATITVVAFLPTLKINEIHRISYLLHSLHLCMHFAFCLICNFVFEGATERPGPGGPQPSLLPQNLMMVIYKLDSGVLEQVNL